MISLALGPLMQQVREFTPSSLAGLALWIDPSDLTTISHTSNAVNQINDKSGAGVNYTASGSARPTTNTVTLNGLNVLDFDGSANELLGPLVSTAVDNFSIYVILKPDALPVAGTAPFINGTGGDGYGIALRTLVFGNKVGYLRGGIAWHSGSTTTPTSGGHLFTLIRTSGTWGMRLNRVSEVAGTNAPNTPTTRSRIGASLNGGFGEALFYTNAHSSTDRDTVESYLQTKWATL